MSGVLGFLPAPSAALGAAIIQGITTGSTRQIVWPLVDGLGQPLTSLLGDSPTGQSLLTGIAASGAIDGLAGYVAILEDHHDELEITSHPVEQGATIQDHAYKLPSTPTMQLGWSTSASLGAQAPSLLGIIGQPLSPLDVASLFTSGGTDLFIRQVYQRLLSLQVQRTLLTIYTGKRVYNNMLIQTLAERTTEQTEHCLIVTATFKEIQLAFVQTVTTPTNTNAQASPQTTTPSVPQGSQQLGPAPNFNPTNAPTPPSESIGT